MTERYLHVIVIQIILVNFVNQAWTKVLIMSYIIIMNAMESNRPVLRSLELLVDTTVTVTKLVRLMYKINTLSIMSEELSK